MIWLGLWAVCLLCNIFLILKLTAWEQVESGKIKDMTYNEAFSLFVEAEEAIVPIILFALILTPIGSLFLCIFAVIESFKKWLKANGDKKIGD